MSEEAPVGHAPNCALVYAPMAGLCSCHSSVEIVRHRGSVDDEAEIGKLRAQNTRLRNALADLLSERRGSDVTEEDDETAVERIARGAYDHEEGEHG